LLIAEAVEVSEEEDVGVGFVTFTHDMQPGDSYQLSLMRDAGLIEGKHAEMGLFRVTNAGHDLLDAMKNEGVWKQTKAAVASQGGNVALELVKSLALGFAKKQLEDRTGMKL
jgi:hypothetical protein